MIIFIIISPRRHSSSTPEKSNFPGEFRGIENIPKLILIRVLRPDRLPYALANCLHDKLGESYPTIGVFNLDVTYEYSTASTPILFILSPGEDPTSIVEESGKRKNNTLESGRYTQENNESIKSMWIYQKHLSRT